MHEEIPLASAVNQWSRQRVITQQRLVVRLVCANGEIFERPVNSAEEAGEAMAEATSVMTDGDMAVLAWSSRCDQQVSDGTTPR